MYIVKRSKGAYCILFWILVAIAFHCFPVLRIAGCVKIYEILGILLFFKYTEHNKWNILKSLLFILFVLSPVLSIFYAYMVLPYPDGFFMKYKEASEGLRFSYYIYPLLQCLFMFVTYRVCIMIYKSQELQENLERILKTIVLIGTVISICSILFCILGNPIQKLPKFIQNSSSYGEQFRTQGFYQEPSMYVVYQIWIVLFTYYNKWQFDKRKWFLLMTINTASLILTTSSTLAAFFCVLLLSPFIFKSKISLKIRILLIVVLLSLSVYFVLDYLGLVEFAEYVFVNKIDSFLGSKDYTTDSGAFRAYTGRIGWKIWESSPVFGVGVGMSQYYMYIYEYKMGIVNFGETLSAGIFPQNMYSCVFAEQGIIGGGSLLMILLFAIYKLWSVRNYNNYTKMFLLGTICNIAGMLANGVVYSLFLWVWIMLALGYVNRVKLNDNKM